MRLRRKITKSRHQGPRPTDTYSYLSRSDHRRTQPLPRVPEGRRRASVRDLERRGRSSQVRGEPESAPAPLRRKPVLYGGARVANMRQGERTDLEHSANLQNVSRAQAADLVNGRMGGVIANQSKVICPIFRDGRKKSHGHNVRSAPYPCTICMNSSGVPNGSLQYTALAVP